MATDDPNKYGEKVPDKFATTRMVDQPSVAELVLRPPDTRPNASDAAVPLWIAIRNRRTDYTAYAAFIRAAFGSDDNYKPKIPDVAEYLDKTMRDRQGGRSRDEVDCLRSGWLGHGLNAYELLKTATEVFLILECGLYIADYHEPAGRIPGAESTRVRGALDAPALQNALRGYLVETLGGHRLPYIDKIVAGLEDKTLRELPLDNGVLKGRVECPCMLELIWSYWHEEGMLVQGMNALNLRFQNRRISEGRDPLAQLELSPLRPLSSVFWGYVQDEQRRLSLVRRNYEYEHEYGIALRGKAVPSTSRAADRRSKFIEAFHDLLFRCAQYYQQSANLQFNPDPFPLLNGLKEVHLLLSQGAGNQFGDLPWTARVEMLMQQWILARPEVKEFLGRRPMVAYPEEWMGNAESLKSLMGWTDTPITHFRNLAVFGEQLLLSIRWHLWGDEADSNVARDWANYWKPEIQGYLHAYRVATGVDLTLEPKDSRDIGERKENPAVLLERRLGEQRRDGAA